MSVNHATRGLTAKPLAGLKSTVYASFLAVLASCTSIGTQYASPLSSQPGATLVPRGGSVLINTFDEKGCYQGRTELPADQEFRIKPGQEVILAYELHGSRSRLVYPLDDSFCRAVFSFVPQRDAHYIVTALWTPTNKDADGKLALRSCGATVFRKDSDGVLEAVAVKKLTLRQRSIACIQVVG